MVTYVDTSFLQIFLTKRFSNITPKPTKFKEVMVRGKAMRKKSHPYMPRP